MILDLDHQLKTNEDFRHQIRTLADKLQGLSEKKNTSIKAQKQFDDTVLQLLALCKWNISILIPYFFPKFDKGRPLNFRDRPFAVAMFNMAPYMHTVIRGSRQIGKTVSLTARDTLVARLIPSYPIHTITPKSDQLKTFANKLKDMEGYYRFYQRYTNFRNNLFFKEFPNKSTIKLDYVLTSASSIRGNSAEMVSIDEAQDFDASLEPEVMEIQADADFPNNTISGTSLTTDSYLEQKWLESSRGIWTMKCRSCGQMNQPIPEMNVMDMIQPEGVCCIKCGNRIDVRDGKWVHESPRMLDAGFLGLHVPKLIVPAVVEDRAKWNRLYLQKQRIDERKFYQEVLGIPTEEGERELTAKNLEDICVLGNIKTVQLRAKQNKYKYVISAADWGGSDYSVQNRTKTSYTVHVAMGIRQDYSFDTVHMRQYSGMNYEEIAQNIVHDHKTLNGFAMASDHGMGVQYNTYLRKFIPANRHLIFDYGGPNTPILSTPKTQGGYMFNTYNINRTETITMLFEAIKKQRIRCYDWLEAQKYLSDFLNVIRAPTESPSGSTTVRYIRHGSKSDDFMHAFNWAYILGRIILDEPLFEDRSLAVTLNQVLFQSNAPLSGPGHFSG
jgi:hypothetical protein